MKLSVEQAIEKANIPGEIVCPQCQEKLFSAMDKLSIALYGKCSLHIEDNGHQEKNLLKISELI